MATHALPLLGVNVVDFGQYIAGPAVAMMLADLGATVVHVDPPAGPMWDNPANAILNRNKLSVRIDLKTDEGLAQAKQLINRADIVIEGFRPGVMSRLGLDFTELRASNPALITLSIPGFASNDHLRREWRAFESIIAAQSGVFTDMGLNRVLMGVNPSFSPLPLGSAYATTLAASSVVLALQSRELTGLGDQIEVPIAASLMEGLSYNSIHIEDFPERYKTQREKEIEARRESGQEFDVSYDELQELLDPFYRSYLCKDGRYFYVVCPSHRFHAKRCLQTLGLYDELIAEGLIEEEDTYRDTSEWESDMSLGVYPLPKEWADKIAERIKAVFITRTSKEWEKLFGWGKFPGAPQRWLQEWIYDDHAESAGLMIRVRDPEFGTMIQPGPLAWMRESANQMVDPRPRKWVEFPEALRSLAKTPRPELPEPSNEPQPWLKGVKILDLCNVIAGPHSVAYLARFGAEVIKIDPATPLYDSWNTVIFGMSHMRQKRSALLDIRHGKGREAFERLVADADIVVWNATDDQVNSMGLDRDGLARLNPNAILCQLDCFSGPLPGPRSNYLGYDDLVQATTGIMLRFGGDFDRPEEHAHVGTIDVMCGFAGSFGVATALFQKYRHGVIGRPKTSLAALSALAQIPFCYDYEGRGAFDEPAGPDVKGYYALERHYDTADGAMMIAASPRDLANIAKVPGLQEIEDVYSVEDYLADVLQNFTRDHWVENLQAVNVAAAPCDNLTWLRASTEQSAGESTGIERGSYSFSIYFDHPCGQTVTQLDPYAIRPMLAPITPLSPAEKYGQSTRAVLAGAGYSNEDIEHMINIGAAADSWSDVYFPR